MRSSSVRGSPARLFLLLDQPPERLHEPGRVLAGALPVLGAGRGQLLPRAQVPHELHARERVAVDLVARVVVVVPVRVHHVPHGLVGDPAQRGQRLARGGGAHVGVHHHHVARAHHEHAVGVEPQSGRLPAHGHVHAGGHLLDLERDGHLGRRGGRLRRRGGRGPGGDQDGDHRRTSIRSRRARRRWRCPHPAAWDGWTRPAGRAASRPAQRTAAGAPPGRTSPGTAAPRPRVRAGGG